MVVLCFPCQVYSWAMAPRWQGNYSYMKRPAETEYQLSTCVCHLENHRRSERKSAARWFVWKKSLGDFDILVFMCAGTKKNQHTGSNVGVLLSKPDTPNRFACQWAHTFVTDICRSTKICCPNMMLCRQIDDLSFSDDPIRNLKIGTRDMGQQLKALTALLKVPSSNPSNHLVAHNHQ